MKVGGIKIFAFFFQVAMVPAYPGSDLVNEAFVFRSEIFAGAPEFYMPLPVMIDKNMNIFMRQVPSYIVIISF